METGFDKGKQRRFIRAVQDGEPRLSRRRGGFDVPAVMESKSTYVRAGIGGFCGRALQKDDELPLGRMTPCSESIAYRLSDSFGQHGFSAPDWSVSSRGFLPLKKIRSYECLKALNFMLLQKKQNYVFIKSHIRSRLNPTEWATG